MKYFVVLILILLIGFSVEKIEEEGFFWLIPSFFVITEKPEMTKNVAIISIIIVISSIASGFSRAENVGKIYNRPVSIGILLGILPSSLMVILQADITSISNNVLIGAFLGSSASATNCGSIRIGTCVFAGHSTALLSSFFANEFGLMDPITIGWLGFCVLMIMLEYTVVFYQSFRQKNLDDKPQT